MAEKNVLKFGSEYVPTINDGTSAFPEYETYSREKIDRMLEGKGNSNAPAAAGYDWALKTITCEGESITENSIIAYPAYVKERTKCNIVNIARGGLPIVGNFPGQPHDFRARISAIPADTDAIIVMGDCNSNDTTADGLDSTDINTWAGRWNLYVQAIKRSFPTVPLFLVSEYVMTGHAAQNANTPYLFQRLARKYGAIFIDLAAETGMSLINAKSVWGLTDSDGVHCNNEAMRIWADVIIAKLRATPPPAWQGADTIAISEASVTVAAGNTVALTVSKAGDLSARWASSDIAVACVMGGVVYGIAPGTATITATTRSGNTAACTVTVSG
jgi:uncharacterized protein YjdB